MSANKDTTDYDKLYDIFLYSNYQITKDGRIWSKLNSKFIKQRICNGYYTVCLNDDSITVHRLVAQQFLENPDKKPYVHHINKNILDNRVENLKWVTQKENCSLHNKQTSHPRVVIQKDKDGKIINKFNSLKEAGQAIGMSESSISKVVTGKNETAGGFKWEYEQEYTVERDIKEGKPIYGNTKYCIFKDGTVYNTVRKTPVKPIQNKAGYCYVTICTDGNKQNCYVHRLVAEHFIENKDSKKTQVNHINKIRHDNRIENLEWVTQTENMIHANKKDTSEIEKKEPKQPSEIVKKDSKKVSKKKIIKEEIEEQLKDMTEVSKEEKKVVKKEKKPKILIV
jgi:hypothetical protein